MRFPSLRFSLVAACLLAPQLAPSLHAATYTWDVATGNATITDGSGTWQVGVGNWYDGTSYDQVWADGNEAVFGGGTAGAAGTVTLGSNVTTANITLSSPNGGGAYTINLAGYTLTLNGTLNATGASGTVFNNGTISTNSLSGFYATKTITFNSKITGTGAFNTSGSPGYSYLNNTANDFTGALGKTNGGAIYLQDIANTGVASSAGAGSSVILGTSGVIEFRGAAGTTNRTLTFSGSNNKSLTNNGSGALIFTGAVSNSSGNFTLTLGGNYSGTNEILGNLANKNATTTLGITKSGSTTWRLSGDNTYNGTTTVSAGTLELTGSLTTSGAIVVNAASNPVLNITGNLTQTRAANARNVVIAGSANSFGTINVSGSANVTFTGMLISEDAGGNGVFNQSGGTVTISGADTYLSGQTSALNVSGGSFSTSSNHLRIGAGSTYGSNSTITVNGTGTITTGTLFFGTGSRNATAMTVNLGDGATGGNLSVTSMSYAAGAGSGATTINFNGGTLTANGTFSMITQASTVVKSGGAFINVLSGRTFTIGTALTDGGGGGGLTKDGVGNLNLTGNSTYTGATTINAGTLEIGAAGRLGAGSYAGNISNNGTFIYSGTNSQTLSGEISGTGALTQNASSTLTLTGNNSYTGTTTINAGTIRLQNASSSETIVGDIAVSGGQLTLGAAHQIADTASITLTTGSIELSTYNETINALTMSGGSLRRSTGTLTLNSASSFTGGTLNFASTGARIITTGTITLGDVTFDLSAAGTSTLGLQLGGNIAVNASTTANFTNTGGGLGRIDLNGADRTIDVGSGATANVGWKIDGAGYGLIKDGAGTLTLSGANTYNGTTTVNAGTLALGANQNLGAIAGAGALNLSSYTLTTNASSDTTYSGDITGTTGGFSKDGAGTLTLSGTGNSWNGTTNINSGTITLSGNLSTTGVFRMNGAGNPVLNITGNLTSTRASNPRNFQIAATAGNTGTVNVSGSGILNTIGMMLGENSGGNSTFNQTGGTVTSSGEIWFAGKNSTMTISGGNFFANSNLFIAGGSGGLTNSTLTVNGTGTLSINSLQFGAGNATNSVTINIGDGTAGGNLSVNGWGGSTGPVTFNFNGGTYTANGTYSLITTNTTTVVKSGGAIFNVTGSNTLTVSNNLTTDGTGGGLTKEGTGTLTLSGAGNNYTGTTTVNAGTLALGANQNLGAIAGAGALNLSSYTLTTNASSDTTYSGNITGTTGGFTKSGTGTLTLSGSGNTWNGTTSLSSGTLTLSGSLTTNGSMAVNGASNPVLNITGDLMQTKGTSVRNLVIAGSASSNGTVNVSGSANVTITGMYISEDGGGYGDFNQSGGTVTMNGEVLLGGLRSSLSVSGGHFNMGANTLSMASGTVLSNSTISVNGTGSITMGQLRMGYASRNTTAMTVNLGDGSTGGNLSISSMSWWAGAGSGPTTINFNGGTLTANGTFSMLTQASTVVKSGGAFINVESGQTFTIGTALTNGGGGGGLTKNGAGMLTLSASNTYTGGTTLNTGTLVIGNTAAAGTGTITQTDGTSLLKFDTTGTIANAMSIYNVSANKTVTLSGGITVNNATFDVASGETLTISNTINGTGGVTKNGTGTLVLSGNNTYSAATVINAGTLNAAHAGALGANTTVTVNDGTLLVSTDDAINGRQITLNGTSTTVATLAFSSNYTGSIGKLTLSADSIIDLGQGNIGLQFADMAMGFYNLSIYNWSGTTQWGTTYGTGTDQLYFNGDYTASNVRFYSGAVGSDSFVGSGFDLGLQQTSWDSGLSGHYILPVPEPETYATGLLLLLGGGLWMWQKRKAESCRNGSPLPFRLKPRIKLLVGKN